MVDTQTKTEDRRPGTAISMAEAVKMGLTIPQPLEARATDKVPGGYNLAQLQQGREQRDTAAWNAVWESLDPKLRTAVQETARDLAEAEQALTGARAQLADLDTRQPSKSADVPKWAGKRGEVAGMISAYESVVHGARQAYERAAGAALRAAQAIMARQAQQATQAHEEAEREYRRRRDAARQYLNEANEARDTIGRLFAKINDGNPDLFR
jgi:chromosome segregation ATPase